MSRYRRAMATGSSYFFTVVAYRRQSILCDEAICNALRASIETVRVARPFVIDAWVLLPDHLHCVWTLPDGDADFSTRWMMINLPAWAHPPGARTSTRQRRAHPT